jgi:hypothetical protein
MCRVDQLQNFTPLVGVIIERKIVVSGKDPERQDSQEQCRTEGRRGLNRSVLERAERHRDFLAKIRLGWPVLMFGAERPFGGATGV